MGIHIHIHYENEGKILESLHEIKEFLNINKHQNQTIMAVLDDIKADLATLSTTLDQVLTGIQGLSTGIDPNGISAADAADLKTSLDSLVAKAQADLAAIPTTSTQPPSEAPAQ